MEKINGDKCDFLLFSSSGRLWIVTFYLLGPQILLKRNLWRQWLEPYGRPHCVGATNRRQRVENSFSHPGKISAFACRDKARHGDRLAVRLNGRAFFIYIRPSVINDSKKKYIYLLIYIISFFNRIPFWRKRFRYLLLFILKCFGMIINYFGLWRPKILIQ